MFNVQEESEVHEINLRLRAKLLEVARIANMERDLLAYKKHFSAILSSSNLFSFAKLKRLLPHGRVVEEKSASACCVTFDLHCNYIIPKNNKIAI